MFIKFYNHFSLYICIYYIYKKYIFSNEIYIAPSGVQKERILPEDLFVQDEEGKDIQLPPDYKQ